MINQLEIRLWGEDAALIYFLDLLKNMPYTFFSQIFEKFGEFIKNPQITDVWNVLKGKKSG